MSVITEFTVPADQFALYETLQSVPAMIVEVERIVAHIPTELMPYFWTSDGNHDAFERAASDDASFENLTKLDELEEAVLYRANWVQNVETPLDGEFPIFVSRHRSKQHYLGMNRNTLLNIADTVQQALDMDKNTEGDA